MVHHCYHVNHVVEIVRSAPRVRVRGGGSKPALSSFGLRANAQTAAVASGRTHPSADDALLLDLSALRGVVDYQADEYTFTARAGAPLADIAAMLAEKGQYLPFDPIDLFAAATTPSARRPLAARGATLGGTVAAGLSGPGRYRYGGIRDFLIGIRFIDGQGEEVRGGGAVVKNAAGFDFPKLFVGSLGRLGILTELTFKVFPQPPAFATVAAEFDALADLLAALPALTRAPIDLHALDFAPAEDGWTLWARIGGLPAALPQRSSGLRQVLVSASPIRPSASAQQMRSPQAERPPRRLHLLLDQEDDAFWRQARAIAWLPDGFGLVKVPLTPKRIPALEEALGPHAAPARRYSVGGNLLWLGWPDADAPPCSPASSQVTGEREGKLPDLHNLLLGLNLQGLQLIGQAPPPSQSRSYSGAEAHSTNRAGVPLLGKPLQNAFLQRIAAALDPAGKFDHD